MSLSVLIYCNIYIFNYITTITKKYFYKKNPYSIKEGVLIIYNYVVCYTDPPKKKSIIVFNFALVPVNIIVINVSASLGIVDVPTTILSIYQHTNT